MGASVTKEQLKKQKVKGEIEVLRRAHVGERGFGDGIVPDIGIWEMEAIPFKYLDPSEQFLLAVERVGIAEIRATISPSEPDVSDYHCSPDTEMYDYTSVLTMNDGDAPAFRALAAAVRGEAGCLFHMVEPPAEDRDGAGGDGEDDASTGSEGTSDGDQAAPDDEDRKEEGAAGSGLVISQEPLSSDCVFGYVRQVENQMACVMFDLYEPEEADDRPVASVSVRASAPGFELQGSRYTKASKKIVWEYVFTMHCRENEKPKDALVKQRYARLKSYLRSISGYAGNMPASL